MANRGGHRYDVSGWNRMREDQLRGQQRKQRKQKRKDNREQVNGR